MNFTIVTRKMLVLAGFAIIAVGLTTAVGTFFPLQKTVTISSKNWECVASDTVGLEARCISYRMVTTSFVRQ